MYIFLCLQIMKMDVNTGDVISWKDPGHFVSEPVFVPRRPHTSQAASNEGGKRKRNDDEEKDEEDEEEREEEDDGALIFTLLSPGALSQVHLVVLDAASFDEIARISFRAEGTVTEGFHGIFVREEEEFHRY